MKPLDSKIDLGDRKWVGWTRFPLLKCKLATEVLILGNKARIFLNHLRILRCKAIMLGLEFKILALLIYAFCLLGYDALLNVRDKVEDLAVAHLGSRLGKFLQKRRDGKAEHGSDPSETGISSQELSPIRQSR